MSHEESEYYRQRVLVERAIARASELPKVAAVHEELAQRYESLIEEEERRVTPIRAVA